MKHSFKPFDRVLVRDTNDDAWRIQFYSHPYEDFHACLNGIYWQCIPYEGNEELFGTTDSPEPELENGDAVIVWDEGFDSRFVKVYSHYDRELHQHMVHHEVLCDGRTERKNGWDHAQKFVPASVEG